MRILTVGDVVGECGLRYIRKNLKNIIRDNHIDFTVVNGENALSNSGIDLYSAEIIFDSGCDVITLGNHTFTRKSVIPAFDNYPKNIIRPLNYDGSLEGEGYTILDVNGCKICVINVIGRIYMEAVNCPFMAVDKTLTHINEQDCKIIIVDFHAEATSEKKALAYYVDGRVSAVFGTHTHTQTADEQILQNGTGFITDVGMTGSTNSVLGLKKEISINKIVFHKNTRYEWSDIDPALMGAIFEVDEYTGKCISVERIICKL